MAVNAVLQTMHHDMRVSHAHAMAFMRTSSCTALS